MFKALDSNKNKYQAEGRFRFGHFLSSTSKKCIYELSQYQTTRIDTGVIKLVFVFLKLVHNILMVSIEAI